MQMLAPASASASTTALPMPVLPPVTMATFPLSVMSASLGVRGSGEPLGEVLADADRVRHRRQRRVHGADAREEAGVDDVEVVELVGLAVDVEDRRLRIRAEAARARLMRHAGN